MVAGLLVGQAMGINSFQHPCIVKTATILQPFKEPVGQTVSQSVTEPLLGMSYRSWNNYNVINVIF